MHLKYPKPTLDIYFHMKNHYRKLRRVQAKVYSNYKSKSFCDISECSDKNTVNNNAYSKNLTSSVKCNSAENLHVNQGELSSMNHNVKKHIKQSKKVQSKCATSFPLRPTTRRNPSDLPNTSELRSNPQEKFRNIPNRKQVLTTETPKEIHTTAGKENIKMIPKILKKSKINQRTIVSQECSQSTHTLVDKATSSCLFPCCDESCDVCKNVSITNRSVEDHEYLQFALRITEDIIRNNLYSNREMKRVFDSHIEANRGRLKLETMSAQVENLRQVLSVTFDDEIEDKIQSVPATKDENTSNASFIPEKYRPFSSCVLQLHAQSEALLKDTNEISTEIQENAPFPSLANMKSKGTLQRDNPHHVMKIPSLERLSEVTESALSVNESNSSSIDNQQKKVIERNIHIPLHEDDDNESFSNTVERESFTKIFENYTNHPQGNIRQNSFHSCKETGINSFLPNADVPFFMQPGSDISNEIFNLNGNQRENLQRINPNISVDPFTNNSLCNSSIIHMKPSKDMENHDITIQKDQSQDSIKQRSISEDSLEVVHPKEETGAGDFGQSRLTLGQHAKSNDMSKEDFDFLFSLSDPKNIRVNTVFNVCMVPEISTDKPKRKVALGNEGLTADEFAKLSEVSRPSLKPALSSSKHQSPPQHSPESGITLDSNFQVKPALREKSVTLNNQKHETLDIGSMALSQSTQNSEKDKYESFDAVRVFPNIRRSADKNLSKNLVKSLSKPKLKDANPLMPPILSEENSELYQDSKGTDVLKQMKDSFESLNIESTVNETETEKSLSISNESSDFRPRKKKLSMASPEISPFPKKASQSSSSSMEIESSAMRPLVIHKKAGNRVSGQTEIPILPVEERKVEERKVEEGKVEERKPSDVPAPDSVETEKTQENLDLAEESSFSFKTKKEEQYSCKDDMLNENVPEECRHLEVCRTIITKRKAENKCGVVCGCTKTIQPSDPEQLSAREAKRREAKFPISDLYFTKTRNACNSYKRWQDGKKLDNEKVETLYFNRRLEDLVEREYGVLETSMEKMQENICKTQMLNKCPHFRRKGDYDNQPKIRTRADEAVRGGVERLSLCGNAMKTAKNQYPRNYLQQQLTSSGKINGKMPRFHFCSKDTCPTADRNIPTKNAAEIRAAYEKALADSQKQECPCKSLLLDDDYDLPAMPELDSMDSFYVVKHFFYPSRYSQTYEEDLEPLPTGESAESETSSSSLYESSLEGEEEEEMDEEGVDEMPSELLALDDHDEGIVEPSKKRSLALRSALTKENIQNYLDLLDYVPLYELTPSLERSNGLAIKEAEHFREPDPEGKQHISSHLLQTEEVKPLRSSLDILEEVLEEREPIPQKTKNCFSCFKKPQKKAKLPPPPEEPSAQTYRVEDKKSTQ